ncbi:MAG: O-antigen ligase family protein [Acidobacteria bacterium]|jgi:O-antigen ligase|nr:O-antigen ligase family protein [Acidobacteriota bacterium]
MTIFKAISPSSQRFQEIEFSLLLGWALLYPAKIGHSYYFGFMCLLAAFALTKAFALKNIALNRFSLFLLACNSVFIFAAYFSPYPYRSLLFVADIVMLSLWAVLLFLERSDTGRYLRLAAWIISISSLAVTIAFALRGGMLPASPCFRNPILQGIASAMAVLVFLHALLKRYRHADASLLALNLAAVVISVSKAAFLGLAVFAAAMVLHSRRRWLPWLGALLLLLALVPNPLRRAVTHSLSHDPYVFDRLDIWSMSARMYRDEPLTGIGPDLFSAAAPRFNFAQDKGASRYGKVPESPHSDFWKVIVENGLPGLLMVLAGLFLAIRAMLSPSWFELPRLLLAFLLAQMLLFNFVFNPFFLLLFFLLLRDLLPARQRFVSPSPLARLAFALLLLFALVVLYLCPLVADRCLEKAAAETDIARRFALLQQAELFSPLAERPPLAKAEVLRVFAARTGNIGAWADALESARRGQRLNRYGIDALVAESTLLREFLGERVRYPALGEEILAPLRRAEKLNPFNPFIRLQQAAVLREFGRTAEARRLAQAALDLEPDYAAALVFRHELAGLAADDPALQQRLAAIREKGKRLRSRPGSYLFNLYRLPEGSGR